MNIELYNLEEDIREENDISNEYPEIVQQIEQIMKQEHKTPILDSMKMTALGD